MEIMPMPRYAILEAPSALGHVPEHRGVERAPGVLLGAGISDGLAARRAGRVAASGYCAERDPATDVMNPRAIREYSTLLADAVATVLDAGEFPVVLGGDCSILLGTMLALRRRGRYGLLYIDGDADFYQPQVNPLSGLLGTMLALRRRGRYGLLYIDGDADFYQPQVNPLSGAASASDLA